MQVVDNGSCHGDVVDECRLWTLVAVLVVQLMSAYCGHWYLSWWCNEECQLWTMVPVMVMSVKSAGCVLNGTFVDSF